MIVLDASVLVAHLDQGDRHHTRATKVLLEAAHRPPGASVVTLAEVLVGPIRAGRLAEARSALRDLELVAVPLDVRSAQRLAAIRAATSLKLPDCCVLLAAEDVDAEAILTFDDRLGAAAARAGLGGRA